ncbi:MULTISPECIES: GNAT family N-acetyltransferase [unclassified Streptomyces]|uniref:GNAT family N-acetyltransferase n=1 Tax=unclassified Streptomyces TaxID=2593676 RepID=UPI0022576170|nr:MULTISPECIES: GNAT family protein [unclassified Streptomyces]MCX4788297.1 GNAT family N-acetyltransferase [Streptomyces sp. NBC_01221]WSP56551.1 GNAT family N-acetyltransferase [Streptomyces sp. NBC_01241]WSP63618.1 GNAT family N-acetyltransferase [Streptomyces sp. NBC_01240]
MNIGFRRLGDSDADALIRFLTGERWPFHVISEVDDATARQWATEGRFTGEENRSFWIVADGTPVGLVRLMELTDDTPMFDLRIRAAYRGNGIGAQAVTWLTRYLFTEFPEVRRVEGTTRQDNIPMRRVFLRCGYVKEAHYRDAWPAHDGTVHDTVGYAILRRDWTAGTVTPLPRDDDPVD